MSGTNTTTSVSIKRMKRTHTCGELKASDNNKSVVLQGWVHKRRDHGGVIFIDLRDRYGITQIVIDPASPNAYKEASLAKNEYVIAVQGVVRLRPEGMKNLKMSTGEIEVYCQDFQILSESKPLPFQIDSEVDVSENLRLKYRYLDLRRENLKNNIILRHKVTHLVRNFLNENNFLEIETPILYKSTPEGARDFIVPSRINPGTFYALPQSPQTLKQLLMVAGFDRYYQIARCFRDEDLRADRQPEFTQIDIEMSFIDEEDIFSIFEKMIQKIWKEILNVEVQIPFPRMSYNQAMLEYGVDKPDTRFELKLKDITYIFKNSEFNIFKNVISSQGIIKAISVPNSFDKISRKDIDEFTKLVAQYKAKGLMWFKVSMQGELSGSSVKYLKEEEINELKKLNLLENGSTLFIVADSFKVVNDSLGSLRLKLGEHLNLIDKTKFNFLWVTGFPLLEYSPDDGRWYACHHPFTSPVPEDTQKLLDGKDLKDIRANAYDLVLNGVEIAGGSLRIYNQKVQSAMFQALGLSEQEAKEKFGFFIEGLQYGTPPHGGMAFGLDRLVMILAGTDAIREVIAFPKTQKGQCLMSESPSPVTPEQLSELHIALRLPKKN